MTHDNNSYQIYFAWQGKNLNIPNHLSDPRILANLMHQMANKDPYSSSLTQYEQFCHESLKTHKTDCFSSIFIYILNNSVAGFLNLRIILSEAEIDYICVDPQYRRQHIAEKLFTFCENFIFDQKIVTKIFLEVGVNNLPAKIFYEKIGFTKISVRKNYYKNGEDALVMGKQLDHSTNLIPTG